MESLATKNAGAPHLEVAGTLGVPARRGCDDQVIQSLLEWEKLVGQARHGEALAVVSLALERTRREGDLGDRLRIARGLALWLSGRIAPGIAAIRKALDSSDRPLTRARALEALGLVTWRAQDLDGARIHLDAALGVYRANAYGVGTARASLKKAAVLRDAGHATEALSLLAETIDLAKSLGRNELADFARLEECDVLLGQGRWVEAEVKLGGGTGTVSPALGTRRHLLHATLSLARGNLAATREALLSARQGLASDGSDPRGLAEAQLLAADFELAAGRPGEAVRLAGEAQALYVSLGDAGGECRSRVRLVHTLLAQGETALAVEEGGRAVRCAPACRRGLVALAFLSLGRALMRVHRGEAAQAFERALAKAPSGAFLAASRLGRALAGGARRDDCEVASALQALEAWGDRRILSYCLADLCQLVGEEGHSPLGSRRTLAADPTTTALIDVVTALQADDESTARWHTALRAVEGVLPWWRAIVVGTPGWELRHDMEAPQELSRGDLAVELAAQAAGPVLVDLVADPRLRHHPTRVLHGLGVALLAPIGAAGVLYVDVREESLPLPDNVLGLVPQLARLIGSVLAEGPQDPPEGPALGVPDLLGRSAVMENLLQDMSRAAPLDVTVHVFGETGTGKEKVARALHGLSRRKEGPWVAVNAATLSDELFESELFGHVKGAFTGAVSDRRGHAAEAEGGTLFIDEVTDLSPRAQAKLLRFVQEREYRRVGDPRLYRANVRIITASNARLDERVAAGSFRSDLMYRLTQETLIVPPLRHRGDDILLLARHFLRGAALGAGASTPPLSKEAGQALRVHDWPGNVRELESEVLRAFARAGGGPLRREHLSSCLGRASAAVAPLKQALMACERTEITRALLRNDGNRTRTARDLGVTRQALLAKINRLGIVSPRR